MARTYNFKIRGDPEEKFRRVQELAAAKGVRLTGTSTKARFSGFISGSFSRIGESVTVKITRKPMIAPWPLVESILRDFIEG